VMPVPPLPEPGPEGPVNTPGPMTMAPMTMAPMTGP
jgi:hypothetical protein